MSVRYDMYFVCDTCLAEAKVEETGRKGGVAFVEPPTGWWDEMATDGLSMARVSTCPACVERQHASHFRRD